MVVSTQTKERKRTEVLIETFIRKQLRLKAHRVTKVESSEDSLIIFIDRMGKRLQRCGVCRKRCLHVHSGRKEREWQDLSMRQIRLILRYCPRRVEGLRCGVRVEDFPWAEPWARVTRALSNAVARLARELSWQGTACLDMWAAYVSLVREHAPQAQILFDRFHIVKHLQEAVNEVRRSEMRRLTGQEKVTFKSTRWLLLKNPWNLTGEQKERLSTLVRWNTPIVRAYYLKESCQLFWEYRQPKRAQDYLRKWMSSAMRSRLEPFKKFVRMLRSHLDGILPWTKLRLSNGAVEGMNNKIKSISHRSFGFRSAQYFIAAIYHCCARLPLPAEC